MGNCFGIGLNPATKSVQIHLTTENNTASSSSVQISKDTNFSLGTTSIGSISTTSSSWNDIPSSLQSTPANLHCFSYNDLKSATRGFRPDSVLGEGGFGPVYKGWIDEQGMNPGRPGTGMAIAVKKLNPESMQGYKEWMTEVLFLGRLQHPNLVRLIGYSSEDEHKLLVYEFLSRGSLDNHLFRRGEPLSWSIRLKIILGAARGLTFLHDASVIYRDLKCSNILLDAECNAKLSDFGLAKGGPTGSMSHVSTLVMGTPGYAAPEYVSTGHLTSKSDIYSFGVVLLEILTGRRVIDRNRPNGEQNLVDWARPCLNDKKKIPQIVDSKLDGQISVKVAVKIGRLALSCLHLSGKTRPQMKEVLEVLESLDTTKKTGSNPPQNTAKQ